MAKLEVYDSQDAIPDHLRDHYVERKGRWYPDAPELYAEGENAIRGERLQRESAIKRAAEAERKAQEFETKLKQLEQDSIVGGDPTRGADASAEFARLKREYDARLAAFEAELTTHKEKAQTAERALQEKAINDVLRAAALESGVPKESVEDLISLPKFRQPWRMTETGEPAPFDGDLPRFDPDAPGRPLAAKSYVREYLKENKHWVPPPSGGGANGSSTARATSGVITVTRAEMRDHQKYRAVTEQAEKIGAVIQVLD